MRFPAFAMLGLLLAMALAAPRSASAETAPFDLAGPVLHVTVTHAGQTLPIAEAPNLTAGDRIAIRAELAPDQSVRYLLVVGFLRGATNPPPKSWFSQLKTWAPEARGGLKVTVPQGAEQALIFLAPQTGGDFGTLVGAVRGRPGAFVRASQDLNQSLLDRSRLDMFLAAVRADAQADPERLATTSPLLARSLAIKLNPGCLQKIPELQPSCLLENRESLVLDDGHSASMAQTLTSGESSDLIQQLSATPRAGGGYYSAYVAAAMDIVRVMSSMHTAQYQYIPALGSEAGDTLSLSLNAAPSFHAPMSVLVTALPAVESPQPPPLRPVDPNGAYCAADPGLVLPIEGAPLAFSTGYAHDLTLKLERDGGPSLTIPVKLDADRGGLVADPAALAAAKLGGAFKATLQGTWGFTPFDGPQFDLQAAQAEQWAVAPDDQASLIVGRDATIHLTAASAACVKSIALQPASGEAQRIAWKQVSAKAVEVTVPLKDAQPGAVTLAIRQFGRDEPDTPTFQTYAESARLDGFDFHTGDGSGTLRGVRLDEVASLTLDGLSFSPGLLTTSAGLDTLQLAAVEPVKAAALKAGEGTTAKVTLKDGRKLSLVMTIGAARPGVVLINESIARTPGAPTAAIQLADKAEAPSGAVLTFALRAESPAVFTGAETVDVATANGLASTTLTFSDGLILQDAHVAVATLDTGKAFSASAFGPLQFRVADSRGAGDWRPLATLVRLPVIRGLACRAGKSCKLSGERLFLIQAVSADPKFKRAVDVPDGFTQTTLETPRPTAGRLYLKLRDAPTVVNQIAFTAGGVPIVAAPQSTAVAAP